MILNSVVYPFNNLTFKIVCQISFPSVHFRAKPISPLYYGQNFFLKTYVPLKLTKLHYRGFHKKAFKFLNKNLYINCDNE